MVIISIIAFVIIVFVLIPLFIIFKGSKDIHIDDGSEVSLGQEDKFIIIENIENINTNKRSVNYDKPE